MDKSIEEWDTKGKEGWDMDEMERALIHYFSSCLILISSILNAKGRFIYELHIGWWGKAYLFYAVWLFLQFKCFVCKVACLLLVTD
jgi:hypothetical protein